METNSRERLREAYSKSGSEYDEVRLKDHRGWILSAYDIKMFLKLFPSKPPSQPILEVGAGTGRFTMPLLDRGYHVVATDINETMLEELRAKVVERKVADRCKIGQGDVFNLAFDSGTFDMVFSFHLIPRMHELSDLRAALLELARVVKPGGRLIFNYRNRRSMYGAFWRKFAATPAEIDTILAEAGLRVVAKRGKWLLTRKTLNAIPITVGRLLAGAERCFWRFWPDRAWDVVITAVKKA